MHDAEASAAQASEASSVSMPSCSFTPMLTDYQGSRFGTLADLRCAPTRAPYCCVAMRHAHFPTSKMAGSLGAAESLADKEFSYLGRPIILLEVPSDDQVCQICGGLLDEPQQVICCGHDVCKTCLNSWLERNNTCPFCRKPEPAYYPDMRNDRAVKNLRGKCPFVAQGCNWQGELRNLPVHLRDCVRGIVKCRQCGAKVSKGDLDEHNSNSCPKRPSRCHYCNEEGTYERIHGEHVEKYCPRYPILCPNMCEATAFPRHELERHKRRCPQQLVPCKYADLGCPDDVIRCEMEEHCKATMARHLGLSCDMVVTLAQRLQDTEKRLQEAEKKLVVMEQGKSHDILSVPLSFCIDWERLINAKMWLSPIFSAPGCSYRFQLRAFAVQQGNSTACQADEHATTFFLLVVDEGGSGKVSGIKSTVTVLDQSGGDDHVSSQSMSTQLKVNDKLATVEVLISRTEENEMYGTTEHRQDMLDMLFDGSSYSVSKRFESYVKEGQLLVKVEMDPVVVCNWYTPPTSAMQT